MRARSALLIALLLCCLMQPVVAADVEAMTGSVFDPYAINPLGTLSYSPAAASSSIQAI